MRKFYNALVEWGGLAICTIVVTQSLMPHYEWSCADEVISGNTSSILFPSRTCIYHESTKSTKPPYTLGTCCKIMRNLKISPTIMFYTPWWKHSQIEYECCTWDSASTSCSIDLTQELLFRLISSCFSHEGHTNESPFLLRYALYRATWL